MMQFQDRKENIYVHWNSTADLTHIFRDASQNPLCSTSPGSKRPQGRLGRKKVADMVNTWTESVYDCSVLELFSESALFIVGFPYYAES